MTEMDLARHHVELMMILNRKHEYFADAAPHLHRSKNKILSSYHELLDEATEILAAYPCEKNKSRLVNWKTKLAKVKKLESKLTFDSLVDLGTNH